MLTKEQVRKQIKTHAAYNCNVATLEAATYEVRCLTQTIGEIDLVEVRGSWDSQSRMFGTLADALDFLATEGEAWYFHAKGVL